MDTVQVSIWVVGTLVFVALLFDFMNGFHDAANSIATIVSTRVLKPHQAVVWAAAFNFLAYFLFQLKVASTIGKGTIDPAIVDYYVVFGALIGAIIWNIITPGTTAFRPRPHMRWSAGWSGLPSRRPGWMA